MGYPRILVVTSTLPAQIDDGTPAFVADLALELSKDFEVRIVAPAVPGGASHERLGDRVEVVRYRFFPSRWEDVASGAILENVRSRKSRLLQVPFLLGGLAIAVRRERRRFRPHAIHAHWIIPQGIVSSYVAGALPIVVTTLGGDLYALNSAFARRLKTRVLSRAAAVTVMNADMRVKAVELGADPAATEVLPMGARLTTLGRVHDAETSATPRLLAVGRLVEKKGFDVLLRGLRQVPGPWELVVVGDGPERASLEKMAEDLPVTFAGQLGRDNLAAQYVASDVAVFPSRRASSGDQDGLPVALLEAMGGGCAIIASDLPGLNEAIEADVSGLLVPENDELELVTAIERVLGDSALRHALGAAAKDRARAHSVEAVGARYRALFHRILTS